MEAWGNFVRICTEGYNDYIEEYDNDLFIRRVIEEILLNEKLKRYSQFSYFVNRIEQIDAQFKKLFHK
jgi:hypothetical protein